MSRMHDGLKRVESKRSPHKANGGSTLDTEPPISSAAAHGMPPPVSEMLASEAGKPDPLPHMPRRLWAPNPKYLLRFNSEESDKGTEEFRGLRSRLYQLREQAPLRSMLVASSAPHEGRSFIAANLAQVMACQQGCRTLLLDADLRTPSLHNALGTSVSPGLSDYLLAEAEDFEIIQKGQIENLFFVPAGRLVSGQSELLSNGRLKALLDGAGSLFDWIIIDSTAAMPVSDAGVISNYCDGALMVVRANSTPFDVVRKAREKLRPERILGVVLNEIRPERSAQNVGSEQSLSNLNGGLNLNRPFSTADPYEREEAQLN